MFRKWLERVNLSFWKKTTILCHCLSQISSYVENHRTLFLAQRPLNIESAFLTPEFETCKRQRPFYESLHVGAYHRSALNAVRTFQKREIRDRSKRCGLRRENLCLRSGTTWYDPATNLLSSIIACHVHHSRGLYLDAGEDRPFDPDRQGRKGRTEPPISHARSFPCTSGSGDRETGIK